MSPTRQATTRSRAVRTSVRAQARDTLLVGVVSLTLSVTLALALQAVLRWSP